MVVLACGGLKIRMIPWEGLMFSILGLDGASLVMLARTGGKCRTKVKLGMKIQFLILNDKKILSWGGLKKLILTWDFVRMLILVGGRVKAGIRTWIVVIMELLKCDHVKVEILTWDVV